MSELTSQVKSSCAGSSCFVCLGRGRGGKGRDVRAADPSALIWFPRGGATHAGGDLVLLCTALCTMVSRLLPVELGLSLLLVDAATDALDLMGQMTTCKPFLLGPRAKSQPVGLHDGRVCSGDRKWGFCLVSRLGICKRARERGGVPAPLLKENTAVVRHTGHNMGGIGGQTLAIVPHHKGVCMCVFASRWVLFTWCQGSGPQSRALAIP